MKTEAHFRLLSLAIFGLAAASMSACVQAPVPAPVQAPVQAAVQTELATIAEPALVQLPSTMETDAAIEIERINSKGFQPFNAGLPAFDSDHD